MLEGFFSHWTGTEYNSAGPDPDSPMYHSPTAGPHALFTTGWFSETAIEQKNEHVLGVVHSVSIAKGLDIHSCSFSYGLSIGIGGGSRKPRGRAEVENAEHAETRIRRQIQREIVLR
jgi:hypothetical protein